MAKTKISEYSAISADNTDISNINIAEGCSPANVNNAIRTVMAQLKDQQAGTSGDNFTVGGNLTVTGTTTLTGAVTLTTALPITNGGTGSTTASGARTNLSAAASGANSDITSLLGITAGTVTSPTITTVGDTNTGIFFPAADTIAFAEGGTEVMRLNSSGNVGIGTTSPLSRLQVKAEGPNLGDGYILEYSAGTIMYNQVIGSDSALYLGYSGDSGSSWSSRMIMDSTGNLKFNSGFGSVETAYGCRAWVNFNGTGTVAIRTSGNVSSITDNGVGEYTVNMTNAMPDTNYSIIANSGLGSGGNFTLVSINYTSVGVEVAPTTTAFRLATNIIGGMQDAKYVSVAVFR
jgi:hypothetical protein